MIRLSEATRGSGQKRDLIEAYAWLQVIAIRSSGGVADRGAREHRGSRGASRARGAVTCARARHPHHRVGENACAPPKQGPHRDASRAYENDAARASADVHARNGGVTILDQRSYYPSVDTDLRRAFPTREKCARRNDDRTSSTAAPRKIASVAGPRLLQMAD
jgi:hypothetical protein